MKKVIGVIAVIVLGVVAQSCGGAEKCPAYSQAPSSNSSVNG